MPEQPSDQELRDHGLDPDAVGSLDFQGVDPEQASQLSPSELRAIRLSHKLQLIQRFEIGSRADEFVYRVSDGTYRTLAEDIVPSKVVRGALDVALDSAAEDVADITTSLRDGDIRLQRWQREMMNHIKNANMNAASLAKGGYGQMGPEDWGRVGGRVQREYEYLRDFAEQIDEGNVPLDGRAVNRAKMYVQGSRQTYHRTERLEMQKRGYNQEKNILGVAEHCPECVALTTRGDEGWVPIGTLPEIGTRQCLGNCKCQIIYRRTAPGEAVDPEPFPGNQV
jgi:hypothetical protein